jgi:hypothetical protein
MLSTGGAGVTLETKIKMEKMLNKIFDLSKKSPILW